MTAAILARRAWVEQIMGLPVSIHVRGHAIASTETDDRVAAVFAGLRRVDEVLSPYRDDSDLSRWERRELALADADPMLTEVIRLCEEARERTDGWFDPRGLPGPRDGRPRYDPSGLVKGWAVERAARYLADLPDHGWCLNAGGDILVHAPDDQPAWRVAIEDPADPRRIIRVVDVRTGAVATSGSAHRGNHIIDPHTRRAATAVRSVTVLGPTLLWADVYATAAAARGTDGLAWLDRLDAYEALLVTPRGLLHTTTGWPAARGLTTFTSGPARRFVGSAGGSVPGERPDRASDPSTRSRPSVAVRTLDANAERFSSRPPRPSGDPCATIDEARARNAAS
jgi:thiamine biosynthesis lipoprotein